MNGQIERMVRDKGFGFITGADGNEYFFHRSKCTGQCPFERLHEGDKVQFTESQGDKGKRAIDVDLA